MIRFELLVAEPSNFEGPDGPNRLLVDFDGFIPGQNRADEYMLLKAVMPFQYNNEIVEFMIASPRHRGNTVYEIVEQGGHVGVARLRPHVSIVRDRSFMPTDIDYCFIGNLRPLQESNVTE